MQSVSQKLINILWELLTHLLVFVFFFFALNPVQPLFFLIPNPVLYPLELNSHQDCPLATDAVLAYISRKPKPTPAQGIQGKLIYSQSGALFDGGGVMWPIKPFSTTLVSITRHARFRWYMHHTKEYVHCATRKAWYKYKG